MTHNDRDENPETMSDPDGAGGELAPTRGGEAPAGDDAEVGELVGRIVNDGGNPQRLARLTRVMTRRARAAGGRGAAGGRWLADLFTDDIAPRVPVRDFETLSQHHEGLDGEELADELVRNATMATTAVGAAGGALGAVQLAAPPLLLTAPAKLVAESAVVAAIEVKLVGELHETYGVRPGSSALQRRSGYLLSWAGKRGLDRVQRGVPLSAILGSAAKAELRKRLMRVVGRHLSTLGPYLTGAAAGGALNRAATTTLARSVRDDLRTTTVVLPVAR